MKFPKWTPAQLALGHLAWSMFAGALVAGGLALYQFFSSNDNLAKINFPVVWGLFASAFLGAVVKSFLADRDTNKINPTLVMQAMSDTLNEIKGWTQGLVQQSAQPTPPPVVNISTPPQPAPVVNIQTPIPVPAPTPPVQPAPLVSVQSETTNVQTESADIEEVLPVRAKSPQPLSLPTRQPDIAQQPTASVPAVQAATPAHLADLDRHFDSGFLPAVSVPANQP